MSSNVRSTGSHREPRGQDITGGIYVAIVLCLAGWTRPVTNAERKSVENVPAAGALLTAWTVLIDLQEGPSVPSALVLKLPKQLSPTGVGDRTRQRAVANHILNAERFDDDHLVFVNESSAQLMDIVPPLIRSASVRSSQFQTSFVTVLGSFLFARETAGETFLLRLHPFFVLRVVDLLSGTDRGECRDADIDPDRWIDLGQRLNTYVFAEQRHVPATCGIETDRDRGGCDVWRERSTPVDVERIVHFRKRQRLSFRIPTKGTPSELRTSSALFSFGFWIGGALLEEVVETGLEMTKLLLKWDAGHVIEERQIGLLLPFGQKAAGISVSDRLLVGLPSGLAYGKGLIADEADAADGTAKQRLLIRCRVGAEVKSSQYHFDTYSRPVSGGGGFLPALNGGVSALEFR